MGQAWYCALNVYRWVFRVRVLISLGRFIPRYFILFDVILNGIVSLVSFSYISLLAHRNARDFWVLILYPATLWNSLMSSSGSLVASLGFSFYKYYVICKQFYFFANWDSFYLFTFLWVQQLGIPMLNNIGSPCFVSDLSRIVVPGHEGKNREKFIGMFPADSLAISLCPCSMLCSDGKQMGRKEKPDRNVGAGACQLSGNWKVFIVRDPK